MNDESLSALLDGECSPSELDRVLRELDRDAALRERLSRLSLAQDIRRGGRVMPVRSDFADRVRAALPLRPDAAAAVVTGPGPRASTPWRLLVVLAAAAGIADRPVEASVGLPRALFPVMSAQTLTEAEAAQHYRWQRARLPPGFRVVQRSRKPAPAGGIVEHVLLSDGLSAVSVFGAEQPAGRMFSGFSHMGATNAYGRAVGTFHVTVVGEVPQSTVRLIGDGFEPAAAGGK